MAEQNVKSQFDIKLHWDYYAAVALYALLYFPAKKRPYPKFMKSRRSII